MSPSTLFPWLAAIGAIAILGVQHRDAAQRIDALEQQVATLVAAQESPAAESSDEMTDDDEESVEGDGVMVGNPFGSLEDPFSGPSRATQRAQAHYERGLAHFQLEEYGDAENEFVEGFRFQALPLFLYNAGAAAQKHGSLARALDHFTKYLQLAPYAPERNEVEKTIRDLERGLKK